MRKQIIFIRGGETFASQEDFYQYISTVKLDAFKEKRSWRDWLIWALEGDHDILAPAMPNKQSADYHAWKIWFERHFNFIKDKNPIIVGNSLGSTFLLKYLSENDFPKKILQLHLVSPAVLNDGMGIEKLGTFELDIKKISKISTMCQEIHLWHSEDDDMVPFKNSEVVNQNLPSVNFHIFKDRKHFSQPSFIELLQVINNAK